MRLGIRATLFAGFGAVLALTIAVAWVGLRQAAAINGRATDTYTDDVVGSGLEAALARDTMIVRAKLLEHVLASGPGDQAAVEADIAALNDRIDATLRQINRIDVDGAQQAPLDQFVRAWQGFKKGSAQVVELSRAGRTQEAADLATAEAGSRFQPVSEAVDALLASQAAAAQAKHTANATTFTRARRLILGATLVALLAGGGIALFIAHNVVDRKNARLLAAEAGEAQLRGLVEAAPDAIVVVDQDGRILIVNAQAEQLFGYAREELLGMPVEVLLPAPDRAVHRHHRAAYATAPHMRPMGTGLDLRARRKDGHVVPVEVSLSPRETAEGMLIITIIRDITERREVEAERSRLLAAAQAARAEAIERLLHEEQARAEAEAANRVKDEFLSIAAHELKTPVTTLKAYAQLWATLAGARGNERDRQALEAINRQCDRLTHLTQDLLEVSRLTLGRLALQCRRLALAEQVGEVVTRMQALTTSHRLRLQMGAAPCVDADPDRLEQVLVNLLSNAIKFSPEGGDITVGVAAEEGAAVVTVQDQGIGIPVAHQAHVFEQFYRAHTERGQHYDGMGIGLYLSREIVVQHGGAMWFVSEEGSGSTFAFSLPIAGSESAVHRAAGDHHVRAR